MRADRVPIMHFIEERYATRPVQRIVETWRVEPKQIIERLTEHFREMGIFAVDAHNERLVLLSMLHTLRHSPEILRLVQNARREEQKSQKIRHQE